MEAIKKLFDKKDPFKLEYPTTTTTTTTTTTEYTNALLIDKDNPNAYQLMHSANTTTFPVIIPNTTTTQTELFDLLRTKFQSIERIGIIMDKKNKESILSSTNNKEFYTSLIKEFNVKTVDYLTNNTLQRPKWVNYFNELITETGIEIGAYKDQKGKIKYSGKTALEKTKQEIDKLYFTKSINYHKSKITHSWANGLNSPFGMAVNGYYMYAVNVDNGTISQILLSNGTIINATWAQGLTTPGKIAIQEPYMYVTNFDEGKISRIHMSDGSIDSVNWVTGLIIPYDIIVYDGYLYVTDYFDNKIVKINISNGSKSDWITGLDYPAGLAIQEPYMYVVNTNNLGGGGNICKIHLPDGAISVWSAISLCLSIQIRGSYMYATFPPESSVIKIDMENGDIVDPYFITINAYLYDIFIKGDFLYVSNPSDGTITLYDLIPQANICFPANTPIQTDQGTIPIEDIVPNKHTIRNEPILAVTRTKSQEKSLILLEKDALGKNYPSKDTIMSREHKIVYNGRMQKAKALIGNKVKEVEYNGEILYNIVMKRHYLIQINHLLCETLHAKNEVAKYYIREGKKEAKRRNPCILRN
jgi:hypothetical protein